MATKIASIGPPADPGAGLVWELVQAVNGLWRAFQAAPEAQQRAVLERLPRTLKAVRKMAHGIGLPAVTVPPTRPDERALGVTLTPIDAALAELRMCVDAVGRLDPKVRRSFCEVVMSCSNRLKYRLDRL